MCEAEVVRQRRTLQAVVFLCRLTVTEMILAPTDDNRFLIDRPVTTTYCDMQKMPRGWGAYSSRLGRLFFYPIEPSAPPIDIIALALSKYRLRLFLPPIRALVPARRPMMLTSAPRRPLAILPCARCPAASNNTQGDTISASPASIARLGARSPPPQLPGRGGLQDGVQDERANLSLADTRRAVTLAACRS
jgi:hypothetical protein